MMTLTAADVRRLARNARPEYVTALVNGVDFLRASGILDSELRLSHFMAQCAAETGGFQVLRESLTYTSASRLRTVWPARFRDKSDGELAGLIRNPIALGDAVYNGRMGNTAPGDGYAYRGGGFLQTTGKTAVESYARKLTLTPSPALLDDLNVCLRFACLEWVESRCNDWADENDLTKVSKAINTGSAHSDVKPVGMDERKKWFAKAWGIFGDKGRPDTVPEPPSIATPVAAAGGIGAGGGAVLPNVPVPPDLTAYTAWQTTVETAVSLASFATAKWYLVVVLGGVYLIVGHVLPWWKGRAA